jgi:hypothetical protein
MSRRFASIDQRIADYHEQLAVARAKVDSPHLWGIDTRTKAKGRIKGLLRFIAEAQERRQWQIARGDILTHASVDPIEVSRLARVEELYARERREAEEQDPP